MKFLNDAVDTLVFVGFILAAFFVGWVMAHNTVSTECEKLNSFYVGSTTYECKVKDKNEPKN